MARIRTVKPEFFQDEDLANISEAANLLAIGLLNHSDDEGYFRANPALIKSVVFPLREPSLSVQDMMLELSNIGYISIHDGTDGKKYGLVTGFTIHQRVNRPTPSKIKKLININEPSVSIQGVSIDDSLGERKGKEGKGKEKDTATEKPVAETRKRVPYSEIVDLYHSILPNNPQIAVLNSARKSAIKARWNNSLPTLEAWERYFRKASESKFLTGQCPPGKDRTKPFYATIDFLSNDTNSLKIIEGAYDD